MLSLLVFLWGYLRSNIDLNGQKGQKWNFLEINRRFFIRFHVYLRLGSQMSILKTINERCCFLVIRAKENRQKFNAAKTEATLMQAASSQQPTIHSICRKCTPTQIMSYQLSLQLHKSLSEMYDLCTTEHTSILNNIVCTSRQLNFEILRNNRSKLAWTLFQTSFITSQKWLAWTI